jgi:hypothetical protein
MAFFIVTAMKTSNLKPYMCKIASEKFPPLQPWFSSRSSHMGFAEDKVMLRQATAQYSLIIL